MRRNNNNDEQLAWQCCPITTWELEAFHSHNSHSCHGTPSPPTAVELPASFPFFVFPFTMCPDGFFVPDGRQLVVKPTGFMYLEAPLRVNKTVVCGCGTCRNTSKLPQLKQRKRKRATGSVNERAANQTRCVRLHRGNPDGENPPGVWRRSTPPPPIRWVWSAASQRALCVQLHVNKATWWQAASLHMATARIGSFLRWM